MSTFEHINPATGHLVYDELCSPSDMAGDCRQVGANLGITGTRPMTDAAPSIRFEDFPTDLPKPEITVSEAAARLAGALHLHLD